MSTEKRVFEGVASTVDYEVLNEPCLRDEHGVIDTCAFEWLKGLLGKYLRITIEILPATPEPANPSLTGEMSMVNVRWFDGYLETFEAEEVRFGGYLLWMRLTNGQNRHIPVSQVRWYSVTPESHAREAPQ